MSSSPHHSVIHKPPVTDRGHDEITVPLPNGEGTASIDKGIYALISSLWDSGVETLYCCEGYEVPEGEDDTAWEWQMYRAYILMKWTDDSFFLIQRMLKSFTVFKGDSKTRWEIVFDYNDDHGPRICLRFPKSDIPKLLEWLGAVRVRLEDLL